MQGVTAVGLHVVGMGIILEGAQVRAVHLEGAVRHLLDEPGCAKPLAVPVGAALEGAELW